MKRNILVLAAHPDDEVLGCGGTIARHAGEGDAVHIVIAAEGALSRAAGTRADVAKLQAAARRAGRVLGVRSVSFLGFPDNRMDTVALLDVVQAVEAVARRVRPSRVYTHHAGDLNVDHRRLHEAALAAFRPLPGKPAAELLFFEVPSSTEWQAPGGAAAFTPAWHVDIASTLRKKIAALRCYASEMRPFPHPRSMEAVEHLARWRGACAGVQAAEAFMLGRMVERPVRRLAREH